MIQMVKESHKGIYDCPVLSIDNLIGDIYLMRLECPAIAKTAEPGQFVNIKVNQEFVPFLRKPFSICRRDKQAGWIEVLWKIVGKGTALMARYKSGQNVNLLGPLGVGFSFPPEMKSAFLVGGGLGVAPLPFLCEELLQTDTAIDIFLGARSQEELSMVDFFEERGVAVHLSTEDGSLGMQGLVTERVIEKLRKIANPNRCHLFSCGPTGFLNAMMKITGESNVEGQVSVETMMGCGFGICVGCPVRVRKPEPGGKLYKLTCIEGPTFNAREIYLDD